MHSCWMDKKQRDRNRNTKREQQHQQQSVDMVLKSILVINKCNERSRYSGKRDGIMCWVFLFPLHHIPCSMAQWLFKNEIKTRRKIEENRTNSKTEASAEMQFVCKCSLILVQFSTFPFSVSFHSHFPFYLCPWMQLWNIVRGLFVCARKFFHLSIK